jgi:hypothetical protein
MKAERVARFAHASNRPRGRGCTREVEIVHTATTSPASSEGFSAPAPTGERLDCIAFVHLLDQYPRRLTIEELGREIGEGDRAAVERAVANLDEACLLQRLDDELLPVPAALRVDEPRS